MSDNEYIKIVANALTTHGRPYEPEVAARFGLWLAYFEATRAAAELRGQGFSLHVTSLFEDFMVSVHETPILSPFIKFSRTGARVIRTAQNFPVPPFGGGRAWQDELKVPLDMQKDYEQLRQQVKEWMKESVEALASQFAQRQGR